MLCGVIRLNCSGSAESYINIFTIKRTGRINLKSIAKHRSKLPPDALYGSPGFYALREAGAEWHFTGHLQANKVKDVHRFATLLQSVDPVDLAVRWLSAEGEKVRRCFRL
jgi:hypothetical protein